MLSTTVAAFVHIVSMGTQQMKNYVVSEKVLHSFLSEFGFNYVLYVSLTLSMYVSNLSIYLSI
jgi:hypothetical protein